MKCQSSITQIMPEWEQEQQLQDPKVFPGLPSKPVLGLPQGLLLEGHAWNTSRSHAWCIHYRSQSDSPSFSRVSDTYGWTTTWLLAQKSSNKMLLRFRSERLFLPTTPLQVSLLLPKWAQSLSGEWRRPWFPATSHCLQIGRELCVAGRPVSRESPSPNLKGHKPVIHWGKLGTTAE